MKDSFDSVIGGIWDAILVLGPDCKVKRTNDRVRDLFGFCPEPGADLSDFLASSSRDELAVMAGLAASGERIAGQPMDAVLVGGSRRRVLVNACLAGPDSGRDVLIIFRDVSREAQLEDELRRYSEELYRKVEDRTAELEESRERYKSLFDKAAVPLCWLDADGILRSQNQAFGDLMGRLDEAAEPGPAVEFITDDVERGRVSHYLDLLRKGFEAPARLELQMETARGKLWIEWFVRFEPLTDQFLVCMIDIDDRKRAERALRDSETRYRGLIDTMPDGVTLSDIEGNVIMVNQRGLELYGADDLGELAGKNVLELVAEEDRLRALENVAKTLDTGLVRNVEYKLLRKDGSTHPSELSASLIRDNTGKPVGYIGVTRDIAERKKAEQAVRESEQRYRSLFESSRDPVYISSIDGFIITANQACIELSGHDREELIGMDVEKFFVDLKERERFRAMVSAQGFAKDFPIRLKQKDGGVVECLVTSTLFYDGEGNPAGFQGIIRDVTLQRKAERALRESEHRYRLLAENSNDVIWTADLSVNFTYASPSIARLLGYTAEEVMKLTPEKVLTAGSYRLAVDKFTEDIKKIKTISLDPSWHRMLELEFVKKDGATVWVEGKINALRDDNGRVTGFLGVFRDISERREAQEAVKRSEAYFRSLIENAQDIISIMDDKGVIVYESPAAERVLGYKPEEMVGKSAFEFTDMENLPQIVNRFEEGRSNLGGSARFEFVLRHRDGSPRYVEAITTNLIDDPLVKGFVVNSRDITARKELEAERERLQAKLVEAERMAAVGELAAGVAHEMNNPLTAVSYYAESLGRSSGFSPADKSKLDSIREAADRIQNLLNKLLNYAAPARAVFAPVDLNSLIAQVLDAHAHELEMRPGVAVRTRLSRSLPAISGSSEQLFHLFSNLVTNALQALPEEGGEIKVSTRMEDGRIAVTVADNGSGIEPADISHIFTPFFTKRAKGRGTGLGLAIVRRVAMAHGGEVLVESKRKKGSSFKVLLPTGPALDRE